MRETPVTIGNSVVVVDGEFLTEGQQTTFGLLYDSLGPDRLYWAKGRYLFRVIAPESIDRLISVSHSE